MTNRQTIQEAEIRLKAQIQAGSEKGLCILQNEHVPVVIDRIGRTHGLKSPACLDELASDLLASAWISIERFDPDKGTLRGWLFGIARYLSFEQRRARGSAVSLDEVDSVHVASSSRPAPGMSPKRRAEIDLLRRVIIHLPHRQRLVTEYDLASASGKGDTRELQRKLGGVSPASVYSLRDRARHSIRIHMSHR